MTEITVDIEKIAVRPLPFILALIAAPLVTGLPAFAAMLPFTHFGIEAEALVIPFAVVAFATIVGAPTYLLFGGPAFFLALRRGGPRTGTVIPALLANLISAPFFLLFYLLLEGADGGALLSTLFLVLMGFPFAAIWGLLFSRIYNALLQRLP